MAHGLCPAFKVGGLCCLFGTFKTSANLEVALALTSRFLLLWDQGRDSGWLPCPDCLPDRCDPLGHLASTCIYPRDGDLTISKASYQTFAGLCPDPIPQVTPELLSTGPPEM